MNKQNTQYEEDQRFFYEEEMEVGIKFVFKSARKRNNGIIYSKYLIPSLNITVEEWIIERVKNRVETFLRWGSYAVGYEDFSTKNRRKFYADDAEELVSILNGNN